MRKEKQKEIERVEMRMKNEMRQKKTGYSKTHRRGTRWKTGSACLAIMLTLCLIISMSFPAVTMGMDTGTPAEGSVIQNSQNTPQGKGGDIALLNEKETGQTSAEEKKTSEASSEEKETSEASSEEVKNLNPKDILRVDFYDQHHPEYPLANSVIDYILIHRNGGGSVALNGEQHLNKGT